jgi:hypothetical protein
MDPMDRPYAIVPCDKGSANYRVKRYKERAEELRTIASDLLTQECHDTLISLANAYDQMAISAQGLTH